MMDEDVILWRFGSENTLIAEIDLMASSMTVYDDVLDERFRDRLKLDNQTGSLNITNTRTEHTGLYQLQSNSVIKNFTLTVYVETNEDEVTYIEPTFYKRNPQKLDVKEDDHVEYAPIAKRR
ncbi:hypothetical protein cypCar_00028375 [Cyprinus carpio]|nr:hypothetical protein cypCar_00028375 [Cyprinus carpio]